MASPTIAPPPRLLVLEESVTDRDLDELEAQLGAASPMFLAAEEVMVGRLVDGIVLGPMAEWRGRCERLSPRVRALVAPRVGEVAAGIVMRALGRWLEERWPWLFEAPRPAPSQDDGLGMDFGLFHEDDDDE